MGQGDALLLLGKAVYWGGGVSLVAGGIFNFVCVWFDWDWCMETRQARFISSRIGRNGARFFYGVVGVVSILFGSLLLNSVIA